MRQYYSNRPQQAGNLCIWTRMEPNVAPQKDVIITDSSIVGDPKLAPLGGTTLTHNAILLLKPDQMNDHSQAPGCRLIFGSSKITWDIMCRFHCQSCMCVRRPWWLNQAPAKGRREITLGKKETKIDACTMRQ